MIRSDNAYGEEVLMLTKTDAVVSRTGVVWRIYVKK